MHIYAQLNENNICIGISQLSGEVIAENMIEIESPDASFLWKKHENGTWLAEKFEPQTTAPLTEFEQVKQRQELMQAALDELILGGI